MASHENLTDLIRACDAPGLGVCPDCGRPTRSLKRLTMPTVWCLGVAAVELEPVTACPACLRGRVVAGAVFQLPLANVLWPVLVLPAAVVQVAASFRPGPTADLPGVGRRLWAAWAAGLAATVGGLLWASGSPAGGPAGLAGLGAATAAARWGR